GEQTDGAVDEARISSVKRSSGWIQTTYNNQESPSAFHTLSDKEVPNHQWRNLQDNATGPALLGNPVNISAEFTGTPLLEKAVLSLNESGVWENQSMYGSPINFTVSSVNSTSSQGSWLNGVFNGSFVSNGVLSLGFFGNESVSSSQTQDFAVFHRLNESSGSTAFDYSGNGFDGNVKGATPDNGSLFSQNTYSFDGADDNISVPHQTNFDLTDYTVNIWFRTSGMTDSIGVLTSKQVDLNSRNWWVALDNGYGFAGGNGEIGFRTSSGGSAAAQLVAPNDYRDNQWHMATAVMDSSAGTAKLYVDGVLQDEDLSVGSPDTQSEPIIIGDQTNKDRYWGGKLANHMVIRNSLSSAEIQQLYLNGKPFQAEYSKKVDTSLNQNWNKLEVNASIPVDTDVDAEFRALDSDGNILGTQFVDLSAGKKNYSLSVSDSEDAEVFFNGTAEEMDAQRQYMLDGNPSTEEMDPFQNSTTEYVGIRWNVPRSVGNEIQTDSKEFEFEFYAEQARHNTPQQPEEEE
ncbi:MAG: hypothetical protein BRC26_01335, partial [Nanohaloarchaea archaeon QH_8_44_6]